MRLPRPLANLSANYNQITLNVFLLAKYKFHRQQVISLEKTWGGIRIRHTIAEYPANIVFLTKDAQVFYDRLKQSGFLPAARVEDFPRRDGSPIYWQVIISAIILWNIFLLFCANYSYLNFPFSYLAFPFLFILFISLFVKRSRFIQRFILKPNRHIKEVAPIFKLLALAASLFAVIFMACDLL
jgi:hypothetical protein